MTKIKSMDYQAINTLLGEIRDGFERLEAALVDYGEIEKALDEAYSNGFDAAIKEAQRVFTEAKPISTVVNGMLDGSKRLN